MPEQRMRSVELRLLGPIEMRVEGATVSVGGPRSQAVLALLATRPGQVVTADWLIDQVWGEQPPRAVRVALQSYISRLRQVAAPETRHMLPRHPRGYLLDSSVVRVDLLRFVRFCERGRDQVTAAQWREGLDSLRAARTLWQGMPFTGLDEVPALTAERYRLEEMEVESRINELTATLEVLGPGGVVGSLRELVNTRPCDERGWRLLMLALYRAGRQTEALDAAAQARRLLVEDHGLDPTQDLTELAHRMLTHDPDLEPQVPIPNASPGRVSPGAVLRGQPPAPPTPLIGRAREVDELLDQWQQCVQDKRARLVLVTGEPGVGKSHLVRALARLLGDHGTTVRIGRCLDEPRLPLQPLSDLVTETEIPNPRSAYWSGDSPTVVHGWEMSAHQLFSVVSGQLQHGLRNGGTLLIIEDVHWADPAAMRMLNRLLAECAELPLLVVATVRATDGGMLAATRGALAELSTRIQPHSLHLEGLSSGDLHSVLVSHGFAVTGTDTSSIWHRTDGVPALAIDAAHGRHRMFDARSAGLSTAATLVADTMATTGDPTELSVLQTASGLEEPALVQALEELIAAGLLRTAPGEGIAVEFCHPFYREAAGARLSNLRRRLVSRRVPAAPTGQHANPPDTA